MDLIHPQEENIRKIEDIIDILKANGNINIRQVAFSLPSETDSTVSANLAKSLESGLSKTKSENVNKKQFKKSRSKRPKSPLPDVISWPSDSDITVLRLKLGMTGPDLKDKLGNVILGDGLHQPDSSSMINLATLMLQSEPPSKHSLSTEEYLLPLTSWENGQEPELKQSTDEERCDSNREISVFEAVCSCHKKDCEILNPKKSEIYSKCTRKSKIARFFRLYFCPCCTCLYKMEKMCDEPSSYFTSRKQSLNIF